MTQPSHREIQELTNQIGELYSNIKNIVNNIITIFLLEFRLAQKSVCIMIFLCIIFLVLISGGWLLLVAMCALLFQHFLHNWMNALLCTSLLNIALLMGLLIKFRSLAKNLYFKHTRKHLFQWRENDYGRDKATDA